MQKYTYTITDANGLCAVPAGKLTRAIRGMDSVITITNSDGSRTASGKDLIHVMGLGIENGQTVTAIVEGGHEEENLSDIKRLLRENL